jgi:hypothetical protein
MFNRGICPTTWSDNLSDVFRFRNYKQWKIADYLTKELVLIRTGINKYRMWPLSAF